MSITKISNIKRSSRSTSTRLGKSPLQSPPPTIEQPSGSTTQSLKKKNGKKIACTCLIILIAVLIIMISLITGLYFFYKYEIEPNINADIFTNSNTNFSLTNDQVLNSQEATTEIFGSNKYDIIEKITLTNIGAGTASRVKMTMAIIQTIDPYQFVLNKEILPQEYEIITDDEQNKFAQFDLDINLRPQEKIVFEANYEVKANQIKNYLGSCQGQVISEYLQPENHIESDQAEIINLADELTINDLTLCDQAKTLYDYLGDNLTYFGPVSEDEGALKTLQSMKGDCTNFSDLYIALARSQGIPSRFVEGLTYKEGAARPEEVKHDWSESYLPGVGWTPIDATWGQFRRDEFFSQINGEHIILTRGSNLEALENNYYFYYHYWWDGAEAADLEFIEEWAITKLPS